MGVEAEVGRKLLTAAYFHETLTLMSNQQSSGMSEDTKAIITILLLIFVFPVGIVMMWVWMKWPVWVKILITFVAIIPLFIIVGAISAIVLVSINPLERTREARDTVRLKDLVTLQESINNAVQANPSINILCNGKSGLCEGDSSDKDPNVRKTDGTGWIKVRLDSLASLPVDPSSDSTNIHSYTYCSDGKQWEIQVGVESKKILEKAATDGGDDPDQYEVGTNLKLCQEFLDSNPNFNR